MSLNISEMVSKEHQRFDTPCAGALRKIAPAFSVEHQRCQILCAGALVGCPSAAPAGAPAGLAIGLYGLAGALGLFYIYSLESNKQHVIYSPWSWGIVLWW